jgi:hypothetical protein
MGLANKKIFDFDLNTIAIVVALATGYLKKLPLMTLKVEST